VLRLLPALLLLAGAAVLGLVAVGPAQAPRLAVPSASVRTSAPVTRAIAGVPEACRAYIKGEAFAEGSLGERVRSANTWFGEHTGETASVVLTDEVLREAATRAEWSVPVQDVRATIEPAGFRVSASAVMIGRFTVRALVVPRATQGHLEVAVRELDTDGLPSFLRPAVDDAVATASDPSEWGLDMRVDGVTTQPGCAVLWGAG
jgi:hypothetical protein